jgi:4-amino-4-deoxy-L-arabinose transferase-like glycosyltransferase
MNRPFNTVLCLVLTAAVFTAMSLVRLVDGDEGFYAMAGRLVLEGRAPYANFFYPQAPLLPFILSKVMTLGGVSWLGLRLFCGAVATCTAAIAYFHVKRRFGAGAALATVTCLALSANTLPWLTVVKTHGLSALCIFSAYAVVTRESNRPYLSLFLGGALLGLAAEVRLYSAIALLPFGVFLSTRSTGPERRRLIVSLSVGFAVAMLPAVWFLSQYPEQFWFDNCTYHVLRSYQDGGFLTALRSKISSIAWVFGGSLSDYLTDGIELLVLLQPAVWLALRFIRGKAEFSLAAWTALSLMLGCLIPTPVQPQYFSIVVPLLLVAAFEARARSSVSKRTLPRAALVLLPVWALISGYSVFYRYIMTGYGVEGVIDRSDAENWRLESIQAVSKAVDGAARNGEPVLSWWPGYLVTSHAVPYPGLENHFGLGLWPTLSEGDAARLRVIKYESLERLLVQRDVRIVILGNWVHDRRHFSKVLADASYSLAASVEGAEVFIAREPAIQGNPEPGL